MMNKLKALTEGREAVFKNVVALLVLQGTNFLIPLIVMQHVIKTIGIEYYGVIGFIQAIMVYFFSITDYGFNITATQEIAVHQTEHRKLERTFNLVLATKLILIVLTVILGLILLIIIPELRDEKLAFCLAYVLVLGQAALPTWFFQGVEKMKYITLMNFVAKLIFVVVIFLFIKQKEDYPFVLFFYGIGNLVSGVVGIFYAKTKYNLKFKCPVFADIVKEITNGWSIFIGNFSISLYINSNVFILGLFASNLVLGYYVIAEKILMAVRHLLSAFAQAIYPHVCKLSELSHDKLKKFYKEILSPFILGVLAIGVGLFVFAEEIILLFSNTANPRIVLLLRMLSFVPFIVALNIPANLTILVNKFNRTYSIVMILGSIINIGLNVGLASLFEAEGTAVSVIITEVFITVGLYVVLRKNHAEKAIL